MITRVTEWGKIEWLDYHEGIESFDRAQVGIVTVGIGCHLKPHIHYDQQMHYILEGMGVAYIDGDKLELRPGVIFNWPAGVTHEVINTGSYELKHIMVSNPEFVDSAGIVDIHHDGEEKEIFKKQSLELLYVAVEAVRTQFLETLKFPYIIFDRNQDIVVMSRSFPEFCISHCTDGLRYATCECMQTEDISQKKYDHNIECRHGMEIFSVPIVFRNQFLGYVQGGYIHRSKSNMDGSFDVYDAPDSTVMGIKSLLGKISKAIKNYCEFDRFRLDLETKEKQLESNIKSSEDLTEYLAQAEFEIANLQINNHFLFNTLNSMASMALEGGVPALYKSIIDLSKMFHYTLRNVDKMVPLSKELEYLRAYLELQKLRFNEGLEIEYTVEQGVEDWMVPFNILQPVVENAFTHGFKEYEEKKLGISIEKQGQFLVIRILNNGDVLDQKKCSQINVSMRSKTAHGLSMIYHKLSVIYQEGFEMKIVSDDKNGTGFILKIPADYIGA